jgi:hypothetical protein
VGLLAVAALLPCKNGCPPVQLGDYLVADGAKDSEVLSQADDVRITRNGRTVR